MEPHQVGTAPISRLQRESPCVLHSHFLSTALYDHRFVTHRKPSHRSSGSKNEASSMSATSISNDTPPSSISAAPITSIKTSSASLMNSTSPSSANLRAIHTPQHRSHLCRRNRFRNCNGCCCCCGGNARTGRRNGALGRECDSVQ